MDNTTVICYICGSGFDTDEFQVLQPGFELTWKSNLQEQKGKNLPSQGAVAPNALPAAQGAVAPNALLAVPGGDEVMALDVIHLPREVRRTKKYGDGHVCEYSRLAGDGKCGYVESSSVLYYCWIRTLASFWFIHWTNRYACFTLFLSDSA
jgi:hypothetical protein